MTSRASSQRLATIRQLAYVTTGTHPKDVYEPLDPSSISDALQHDPYLNRLSGTLDMLLSRSTTAPGKAPSKINREQLRSTLTHCRAFADKYPKDSRSVFVYLATLANVHYRY